MIQKVGRTQERCTITYLTLVENEYIYTTLNTSLIRSCTTKHYNIIDK